MNWHASVPQKGLNSVVEVLYSPPSLNYPSILQCFSLHTDRNSDTQKCGIGIYVAGIMALINYFERMYHRQLAERIPQHRSICFA